MLNTQQIQVIVGWLKITYVLQLQVIVIKHDRMFLLVRTLQEVPQKKSVIIVGIFLEQPLPQILKQNQS